MEAFVSDERRPYTYSVGGRYALVPFTSGLFAIYAFFWPVSFGHWFGSIIHAVRVTAGF